MGRSVHGSLRALWRSATRPAIARRCAIIALVVGTLLSAVNQWDALTGGRIDRTLVLRVFANYPVPFIVSNLGAFASATAQEGRE